jgi:hypothetical protein
LDLIHIGIPLEEKIVLLPCFMQFAYNWFIIYTNFIRTSQKLSEWLTLFLKMVRNL